MNLSIITPVFNERKRIEEYLKRLEKQTVKPEIVLVDGGSTDGTIEFIKQYQKKHKNVKLYFETGEYRSPANARNIGVKKAIGEVIHLADVDTIFEKKFTEKIIKEFKREKKRKIIKFKVIPLSLTKFSSLIQKVYYWRDYSRWIVNPRLFIFKKELVPLQNSSLGYGEDKLIQEEVRKIFKKHPFKKSSISLSYFVLGPSSLSEVWKRYKWYGRTGMLYYNKSKDKIHLLKMLLAFFSIPFFPLILIPMARGFIYSLRVIKQYPQGVILIPLLEAISFPAMAIGIWEYLLGKSKKHRGH